MQNFTLGKKGLSMLFFTFILLIGSLPSYGQVCPEPGDFPASQTFCYLQTIDDLDTDGYPVFQTSDTANDTQPIPGSELLTNEAVYYVNSPSGDCRSPLTVTVTNAPRPANTITDSVVSGFEFTTCTPATFDSGDLANLFTAQTGYRIEVYATEESTTALSGDLNEGDSYFVGQVPDGGENAETGTCPSLRVAVGFNPNQIEAPDAEAVQTYCESATVADLEASGTYDDTQAIRWYRSQTANSPLSDDTQLISGQSYFAAQVVNERGSPLPPCETPPLERAEVRVEYEPAYAGEDNTAELCQAELQERLDAGESVGDIFMSYLVDGDPTDDIEVSTDGTFSDASLQDIATAYSSNPFQTFETTYTVTNEFGCTDSAVLALTVTEDENAGDDNINTQICYAELQGRLDAGESPTDIFLSLLDEGVSTTGSFDPPIDEIVGRYSDDPFQTFETTYTLGEGTNCEDSAELALTVTEGESAGDDNINAQICYAELQGRLDAGESPTDIFLSLLDEGVSTTGSFDPPIDEIVGRYSADPYQRFETTYTLGEGECADSAELALTVLEGGNVQNIPLNFCTAQLENVEEDFEFLILLAQDLQINIEDFDPAGFDQEELNTLYESIDLENPAGTYSIIYRFGDEECSDSALITITITDSEPADLEPIESDVVCQSGEIITLSEWLGNNPANGTFSGDNVVNGTFDPSTADTEDYEITYTVPGDEENCVSEGSTTFTISVTEGGDTVADNSAEICNAEVPVIFEQVPEDVVAYFIDLAGGTEGGTFEPSIEDLIADYAENNIGDFRTVYTVGEGTDCEDSAVLVLTVTNELPADAGDDRTLTFCTSEGTQDLADFITAGANDDGTFTGDLDQTFDPAIVGAGTYTVTYTVDDTSACVTEGDVDTASFTITITEGGDTVADNSAEICNAEVPVIFEQVPEDVVAYFIDLAGGTEGGTFEPSIEDLIADYAENNIGDFRTVYTVGEGTDCEDSAVLVLTVTNELPADAGDDRTLTFCTSEGTQDLADFITAGANDDGTFTGDLDQTFDPAIVGAGTYTVTYTVDDTSACVTEGDVDTASFTITITEGGDTVADNSAEICNAEVPVIFEQVPEDVVAYFIDLAGGTEGGTFEPSIEDLIADYAENNIGDFRTVYTVGEGTDCEDSAVLVLTVTNELPADAGDDRTLTFCTSEGTQDLADFITAGANDDGTFTGDLDQTFDPAIVGAGTYTVTYTVDDTSACVTEGDVDTASFTITITEGGDTVADNSAEICNAEVPVIFEQVPEDVVAYFIDLAGGTEGGTFEPSIEDLIADYAENNIGDFRTVYTVGEGTDCEDSAVLVLTVTNELPADAGDDRTLTFCTSEGTQDLADFITAGANDDGTFTGDLDQTFDPAIVGAGTYTVTYTVDDTSACVTEGDVDTASFTITITEGDANAGEDVAMVYCITEIEEMTEAEALGIFDSLLGEDVDQGGEFSPSLETLIAQFGQNPIGTFETTYTVGEGECQDSAELTITINDEQQANAGSNTPLAFCSTDGAVDLTTMLNADANQNGFFEGLEDNMFNPSEAGVGTYTFTYTVDSSVNCVVGEDSATYTISVTEGDANAGDDVAMVYCITEIDEMTEAEALGIFDSLLGDDVDQGGEFSPSLETLIAQFVQNPIGIFETTYTVGNGECQDSAELTITINEEQQANAGSNTPLTFCSTEGVVDLTNFLNEDANQLGFFEELEDNMFNPSEAGVGTYTFTYTVDSSVDCVVGEDSATYTIMVIEGVNAGENNSIEICQGETPSSAGARDFFLSLLEEGVSRDGTFEPTIQELIDQYNNVSETGLFETTYTVSNGECEDSVLLSVTVLEATQANAGEDRELEICSTEGAVNLFDFLSPNATLNGSFEGYEDGMFDASNAEIGEIITINYMISEDEAVCASGSDESVLTITVIEPTNANAGGNIEMTYCIDQDENIQLSSLLGEGANTRGEFSAPYANGIFNPATAGEGEYAITYTVDEDDCAIGTDTATITITVGSSTSEAPVADAEQLFCLGGNATVADLVATGDNIVWYTDAALTTVADETTVLLEGAVYYVVSTDGTPCGTSDPVMVTVGLTDSVSPTLQLDGNEFCRSDNPTVQELINNLNGSGINIYQSNTGGTALATTAALENGVTYYATATDPAVGCESTERIAINVEVSLCGIPEGFSPNGDNINDRFEIAEILEDYPNYSIEIYNRWGNMVFEGNSNMPDWDGVSNQSSTLGDDVLPAGVYFYILNYNDGQTTPVQGKLYLSR